MNDESKQNQQRDDEDWLNALAGRPTPEASDKTRREAEALRLAVLEHYVRKDNERSDDGLVRGREKLLFRLQREDLLKPKRPWWRHPGLLSGLAATLVGVAILLPWLRQANTPVDPISRSPPTIKGFRMPAVVIVEQPAMAAQELAAALAKLGLSVQAVSQNSSWFIDVHIEQPPPAGLQAVLDPYGITLPADQRLLVEFMPRQPLPDLKQTPSQSPPS